MTPKLPVVVVLGATGTGKTALSIAIAERFNGEVVNADSRAIYRGMDIGVAKPTPAERRDVPHHLLDIADPTDDFSLAMYLDAAHAAIEAIAARGRLPVVVGGTPQYLRALLEGWQAPEVPPNDTLRAELNAEPAAALHARLRARDPRSADRIGPHNKRRMIRAMEIVLTTGQPISASQVNRPPPYRFFVIGLRQDRGRLRARVDERVRVMFAGGWLDEARRLRERGANAATPAMSAHGYREALGVLSGELTLDRAIARTQIMVHRYIRHQETWFRRFDGVHWFDSADPAYLKAALADVDRFLRSDVDR